VTLLLELLTTIVSANGSSRSLHVFSTALPCDVLRVVLHTCPGQCVECCIGLQRAVRFAFTIGNWFDNSLSMDRIIVPRYNLVLYQHNFLFDI